MTWCEVLTREAEGKESSQKAQKAKFVGRIGGLEFFA